MSKISIGLTRNNQQLTTVRLLFSLSLCQRRQVFKWGKYYIKWK